MISPTTARALRSAGLVWHPARGDAFVILDRDMDADVFVLSDMTIEAHDHATGRVLGFNGTTEWALDSVDADQALWLPGETALRERLGPAFGALTRREDGLWAVRVHQAGTEAREVAAEDAQEAYGLALLSVLARTARDLLPVAAAGFTRRARDVGGLWGAPAPVPGETVGDVVQALTAAHRRVPAVLAGTAADPGADPREDSLAAWEDPVADDRGDPVAAWEGAVAASLAAWAALEGLDVPVDAGDGPVPAREYAEDLLADLTVRTWDLAHGARLDERLDAACVRHVVARLRRRAGGAAAAGEDPQHELLALTGRDPE